MAKKKETTGKLRRRFRPFKKARDFVHALGLRSLSEWTEYCRGTLADQRPRPDDIPAFPRGIYKDQGWMGYDDWLGTGKYSRKNARPFKKARDFVHRLELETQAEWTRYCKGELPDKRPKPYDIPASPNKTYQGKGWQGMGDWLGTGNIAPFLREFRPLKKARGFVRTLKLKNQLEWQAYCRGDLPDKPPKPDDIPSEPNQVYEDKGWGGLSDWLGTDRFSRHKIRPFKKARDFVRALELKSGAEWRQYYKGDLPNKRPKPVDIPASPNRIYKNQGWQGRGDWLGTAMIATIVRKDRPFKKARDFVRALELKSLGEWTEYCRGTLPGQQPKPDDIPAFPMKIYKDKGWNGYDDWLGIGKKRRTKARPFKEARHFALALGLKDTTEWK